MGPLTEEQAKFGSVIHFSLWSRVLCTGQKRYNGRLYSARPYRYDEKAYFIYATSDNLITCKECIKRRIDFHLMEAGKLEQKLQG